jgi:hypothetical protein
MSAQRAEPEASSMLQDLTIALQSASGQTSLEPVDLPTTARKKRAGQTDLLITTLVVLIQGASVSQLLALTVLGNLVPQEQTDHLLTVLTQIETHQTGRQEAMTAQIAQPIVQHVQTLTVLGNPEHLELTEHLLTETIQTDHPEQEATTAQIAQIVQSVQTQTVLGNPAHQEPIAQSAPAIQEALLLVQTPASMTGTAILSARTAFHAIAQEMRPLLALAIRTQTRRPSSKTRF